MIEIKVGARVLATDASGTEWPATIVHGPARDRDGIRGRFVKFWLRFDDWTSDDDEAWPGGFPWPANDVRLIPDSPEGTDDRT